MTEIKSDITVDLSDLKESIDQLTVSLSNMFDNASDKHIQYMRELDEHKMAYSGISKAVDDMAVESRTKLKSITDIIINMDIEYENFISNLKSSKKEYKVLLAEAMPSTLSGLQSSIGQFKNSILSELPFGGLLGFLVMGEKTHQKSGALAARAARVFQQTSEISKREISKLHNEARSLGVSLGLGPEGMFDAFTAASKGFAEAGVNIEDALKKISITGNKTKESMLQASIRIDSLFKQADGTSAQRMGQLVKDFNVDIGKTPKLITSIGLMARESGISVDAFTTSIMKSAQALRTQRVDVKEVARAQLEFKNILEKQGMGRQFAAGYAERSMSQAIQGISGMSVGLSAVIGERISRRNPELTGNRVVNDLEAYYALREGFGGKKSDKNDGMFVATIKELISLAKENNRTVAGQRFFLQKMGLGFEGAKLIVEMGKKGLERASDRDVKEVLEKNKDRVNNAFRNRMSEIPNYIHAIKRIQEGLAKISSGMLIAIVNGIANIIEALTYIGAIFSGDKEEKEKSLRNMYDLSRKTSAGVDMIIRGVKQSYNAMAGPGSTLSINNFMPNREAIERKYYAEKGKLWRVGSEYVSNEEIGSIEKRLRRQSSKKFKQILLDRLESSAVDDDTLKTIRMTLNNKMFGNDIEAIRESLQYQQKHGRISKLFDVNAMIEQSQQQAQQEAVVDVGDSHITFEILMKAVKVEKKDKSRPVEGN